MCGGSVQFNLSAVIRVRTILETNNEVAVLFDDGIEFNENEPSLLIPCQFVVVQLRVCPMQFEVNATIVGQNEGVVAEILGCFDVILVSVCPMKLDLFSLVGNGVDAFLVST